jgi:type II secretory pathway pseudopilin PulG
MASVIVGILVAIVALSFVMRSHRRGRSTGH